MIRDVISLLLSLVAWALILAGLGLASVARGGDA